MCAGQIAVQNTTWKWLIEAALPYHSMHKRSVDSDSLNNFWNKLWKFWFDERSRWTQSTLGLQRSFAVHMQTFIDSSRSCKSQHNRFHLEFSTYWCAVEHWCPPWIFRKCSEYEFNYWFKFVTQESRECQFYLLKGTFCTAKISSLFQWS